MDFYTTEDLIQAALTGDVELAKNCLDYGININDNGCLTRSEGFLESPALQYAIQRQQIELIQLLLDAGASLDYKDKEGYTPLQRAIFFTNPTITQLLLAAGAEFEDASFEAAYFGHIKNIPDIDVNVKDSLGFNLRHYAAANGQIEILEMLLSHNVNLLEKNDSGVTPLLVAAYHDQVATVSWLLKNGASLNEKDNSRYTALLHAAEGGATTTIQELLKRGASLKQKSFPFHSALFCAAVNGRTDTVSWLLKNGASITEKKVIDNFTAIMHAVMGGHTETALYLQKCGAKLAEKTGNNSTLLMIAAIHGDINTGAWLLSQEVNLHNKNNRGETALLLAIKFNQAKMVQWLLDAGACLTDKSNDGKTALLYAAAGGHTEMVAWLLDNGASITEKSDDGVTAMLYAAAGGYTDTVIQLLSSGASITERSNDGRTAMLYAAAGGYTNTVIQLLSNGANITEKSDDGRTALLYAASKGHVDTVIQLLSHGVSISERSDDGRTALLHAASERHMDTVVWLLNNGASTNERDNSGRTALLLASCCHAYEIVGYLLNNGASLEERDDIGRTALLTVVSDSSYEAYSMVAFLLEKGANLSEKDYRGNTALNIAITGEKNRVDVVMLLLLFYNDLLTPNEKNLGVAYLDKLKESDSSIQRALSCINNPRLKLCLIDSTVTITADTITLAEWLDIISVISSKTKIKTVVVTRCRFISETSVTDSLPDISNQSPDLFAAYNIKSLQLLRTTFDGDTLPLLIQTWKTSFLRLVDLQIINCQLVDDSVVHLKPIFGFDYLETLDLSKNVLGYEGANELLRYARNTNIKFLSLANNFVYISKIEASKLNNQLSETKLTKFNVSMNYFLQASKNLLFKQTPTVNTLHLYSSCMEKSSYSLLIDDEKNCIAREQWNIFLLRDGKSQDGAHVRLLIEGVRSFGQRFLTQFDFRPVGSSLLGIGTVKGKVEIRSFSPDRLFEKVDSLHFKAYPVSRLTAKKLIRLMLIDKGNELYYNKQGGKNSEKSSGRQTYNCFTWAFAKLVQAGIAENEKLPTLLPYPPFYLQGRYAMERQLLTPPAENAENSNIQTALQYGQNNCTIS